MTALPAPGCWSSAIPSSCRPPGPVTSCRWSRATTPPRASSSRSWTTRSRGRRRTPVPTFVDVWEASEGHDVCAGDDAWVSGGEATPSRPRPTTPTPPGRSTWRNSCSRLSGRLTLPDRPPSPPPYRVAMLLRAVAAATLLAAFVAHGRALAGVATTEQPADGSEASGGGGGVGRVRVPDVRRPGRLLHGRARRCRQPTRGASARSNYPSLVASELGQPDSWT